MATPNNAHLNTSIWITSPATILLVDNTPSTVQVLAQLLEGQGLQVVLAQSGAEALARAVQARPDLVLLDVMTPDIDGFETCRRLKKLDGLREVPVIFMTARPDSSDKANSFLAGGVDYVSKPLHIDEVLMRIHTQLTLRAAQRQLADRDLQLQKEVALRQQSEISLQRAYNQLEERVAHRTAELANTNARLQSEMNERLQAQMLLQKNESRMRRLVDSNIIGIFFWDRTGLISDANDAFLELVSYTRQDLQAGKIRWEYVSPREYQAADERALAELLAVGSCTPHEREYLRKDGSRVPVLAGAALFGDSQQAGVAFVLDLSERKRAEQKIRYLADHDALTGLPNRMLLQDRLKQAMAHAQRKRAQVAVLFIDLDYFKHINDSLGHQVGDQMLKTVADRLLQCVRDGDSVARLGGDEFVLCLPLIHGGADAARVAEKTLSVLNAPFICESHELHVSASIGISLYPEDGTDVDTLMRTADTAMYYAKEKGRGHYQFFTASLNQTAQRRLALSNSLRHALARGELTVHYQPQIDLHSGKIFSAEALLRWQPRGAAPISCGDFITIAEETGLILPIGEWVLRQACQQLKIWHDQGFDEMVIAVNLSPRQFFQANFISQVHSIIEEVGVPARCLDLEITESILMQRSEENVATLNRLSAMGIKLSVDDFGTGYFSLAYLQRFPVDALKIDRSFISGIGQDCNDTALVRAIISMANSLHLNVLAEGVENQQQIDFLQAHGCMFAQGFYYSRALPADELTLRLRNQLPVGHSA